MLKGQVLYSKPSGSKVIFDEIKNDVIYAHVESGGYEYDSKPIAGILAKGYWDEVYISPDVEVIQKHEEHDQSTHGSWADGQEDYKMTHRPGDIESGASLDNVSGNDIYPDDVYTPNGLRNYSTGYPELDKEAHALIMRAKGNPEMTVTIYRAVPNDAKITEIKDGDWVTPTRGYAKIHGESNLNNDYKIISAEVKAKDIYTSGDSWHEWGYSKSSSVEKHGEHDQSSHGSWADGISTDTPGQAVEINPDSYVESIFPADFHKNLSADEIVAVANYQMVGFLAINKFLRDDSYKNPGGPETSAEKMPGIVSLVDSAISKAPLVMPDNSAVYRVVNAGTFEEMQVGDTFTDKGFVSTTLRDLSKMPSEQFKRYDDAGKSITRIDLGDNKSGLSVNSIHANTNKVSTDYLDEREFLLPRDSVFEYRGYDEENQVHVIKRVK